MKTIVITKYEQEDFDAIKDGMTTKKAIEILEDLPHGWFPYNLPCWRNKCYEYDYDNYKISCAIWHAIDIMNEHLKENEKE